MPVLFLHILLKKCYIFFKIQHIICVVEKNKEKKYTKRGNKK